MAEKPPVPAHALGERRDATIRALIDSFAADRLTVEEYEARLDLANRARDLASLEALTRDLPAPAPAGTAPTPAPTAGYRVPAPRPEEVRERQVFLALMGGVDRQGAWTPARHSFMIALMGGASFDFREARLPPGVTELDVFVVWGGVEIIVPPDIIVDCGGVAIMGGFEHAAGASIQAGPETPVLKVGGFVLMGGVEIDVRLPGETARDTKRRRREERKKLGRGARDDS